MFVVNVAVMALCRVGHFLEEYMMIEISHDTPDDRLATMVGYGDDVTEEEMQKTTACIDRSLGRGRHALLNDKDVSVRILRGHILQVYINKVK